MEQIVFKEPKMENAQKMQRRYPQTFSSPDLSEMVEARDKYLSTFERTEEIPEQTKLFMQVCVFTKAGAKNCQAERLWVAALAKDSEYIYGKIINTPAFPEDIDVKLNDYIKFKLFNVYKMDIDGESEI